MFATADQHFGHVNISRYAGRPFADVVQMDAALLDAWNDTVGPGDEVWVLGDFALGRLNETLAVVELLHGVKWLVPGNHDRCWSGRRKGSRSAQLYLDAGFAGIVDSPDPWVLAGQRVEVSHFPFRSSADDAGCVGGAGRAVRYGSHRPVSRGGWLVHGHIHDRWRVRGRQVNVGVDAWAGRPVSFETLESLVAAGPSDLGRLVWEGPFDRPGHDA